MDINSSTLGGQVSLHARHNPSVPNEVFDAAANVDAAANADAAAIADDTAAAMDARASVVISRDGGALVAATDANDVALAGMVASSAPTKAPASRAPTKATASMNLINVDGQEIMRLPTTWAGAAYLAHLVQRTHVRGLDAGMAVGLWIGFTAAAHRYALLATHPGAPVPSLVDYIGLLSQRIYGARGYGVVRVYWDPRGGHLRRLDHDGTTRLMLIRGGTPTETAHLHELRSTRSYILKFNEEDRWVTVLQTGVLATWNHAMGGTRRALAVLGIPVVEHHDYPAAHLADDVRLAADGVVEMRRTTPAPDVNDQLDVVGVFDDLRARGILPFATAEDVRRFVVALALPLIRLIAPGLLGIVWFVGASGAGKDFLAGLLAEIWERALAQRTCRAQFDLDCGRDELELKRNLSQAGGALYARAKEAGKRGEHLVAALIRLAATDTIAARAMRQDEVAIANTYTYIADSVEDVPGRREISRRTLVISLTTLDNDALGAARAEVVARAPEFIASLRRLVEQQPPEYYMQQTGAGGRPVGQVAMARLIGCHLDAVEGRDLDGFWDALVGYTASNAAATERQFVAAKIAVDKRVPEEVRHAVLASPSALAVYRTAAVVEASSERLSPHRHAFEDVASARQLVAVLKRETTIDREVREHGYMRVDVGGQPYALRLLRDDRYLLWMPVSAYRAAMSLPALEGDDAPSVSPPPFVDEDAAHHDDGLDATVTSLLPYLPAGRP